MAKRALVLGGGGVIGIAWMTGMAASLAQNGINLTDADLFVGTSAGSVVGTQLAFGMDPETMLAVQRAEGSGSGGVETGSDPATVLAVLGRWFSAEKVDLDLVKWLGEMALKASTMPEEKWVGVFGATLGGLPWPAKPLKVTAVNAETGELTIWTRDSKVELHRAVASSCSVPGILPTVGINGARYMDGGVWSGTHATQAEGFEKVLVIAPMGSFAHGLGQRTLQAEVEQLRATGSQVEVIVPDAEAIERFGPNLMDPTRRAGALEAGIRQGKETLAQIQGVWVR